MSVTIKDVAKKANVSISTVSYAINGSPKITEKTRLYVLKIAKEMNYIANSNAKMLKTKRSGAIGLFFNSWFGPIYSELVRGIQEQTHSEQYDLVACSLYGGEQSTAHKYLRERIVDGAIILSSSFDNEFIKSIASENLPVVVLDRELKSPHIYSVLIDNFGGAFKAVNALVNAGATEITFFSGPEGSYDNQKRLDGFIAALGYNRIPLNPGLIIHSNFTEADAYQKMNALIEAGKMPSAIFSANDEMAIGILRAAKEHNIQIPDQLKIVGFDNIYASNILTPALTTIDHHKYEMGVLSAKVLLKAIREESNIDEVTFLPTELIERETL
ncbi:substrate-binding domain-containing protein [Proteus sp. G2669]|uniref:LacI family DNA-binding transcriptional regulator n=1 Tax=unclassified Proteus (in: enterobacteria) TaxID=257482 RepID=UPI001411F541|nr:MULTISPECIES: LacI family DNA-binding transcriptional regulator [unclassified Proteus (in: enterobacteria)]NBM54995.1 substrate-binding domain-containing protein [Proteus sp. G2669]UDN35133.1 LacI family transcriptional regulator [Proteus sp. NMG38-2]